MNLCGSIVLLTLSFIVSTKQKKLLHITLQENIRKLCYKANLAEEIADYFIRISYAVVKTSTFPEVVAEPGFPRQIQQLTETFCEFYYFTCLVG